jgi:hypothetical protein
VARWADEREIIHFGTGTVWPETPSWTAAMESATAPTPAHVACEPAPADPSVSSCRTPAGHESAPRPRAGVVAGRQQEQLPLDGLGSAESALGHRKPPPSEPPSCRARTSRLDRRTAVRGSRPGASAGRRLA